MTIQEITEKECREVLAHGPIGRLGCCHDSQRYVVPVYFAYEDGDVYSFSTLGQKIEWMRMNSKVCFQVDEITNRSQCERHC